jgi:hypothetical protein
VNQDASRCPHEQAAAQRLLRLEGLVDAGAHVGQHHCRQVARKRLLHSRHAPLVVKRAYGWLASRSLYHMHLTERSKRWSTRSAMLTA